MPSVCGVAISLYRFCASCGPSEPASINFHFPDFFLRVGGIREGEKTKAICRLVMVCPVNGEGMGYLWILSFIVGMARGHSVETGTGGMIRSLLFRFSLVWHCSSVRGVSVFFVCCVLPACLEETLDKRFSLILFSLCTDSHIALEREAMLSKQ